MPLDIAKATVLVRDLTAKFDAAATASTPFYPTISTIVNSQLAQEKYGWIGSFPGMREWLGERKFNELRAATYEVENKLWESSLLIPKDNIADDVMGMYPALLENLAAEAVYHPDELLFSTLIQGESATCFDGQYFFDTDHSWGESGSQSNDVSSTVSSTSAVTSTEMKTAIRGAVKSMLSLKNDHGKLFHRPTLGRLGDLTVVVPPALRDQTYDAMEAQLINGGESNVIVDKPQIMTSAYLTSPVKFYVFRTGQPLKPFVFQAREPLSRMTKGLEDLETKDVKFMTRARYNIGYLAWWNAVQVTLSA